MNKELERIREQLDRQFKGEQLDGQLKLQLWDQLQWQLCRELWEQLSEEFYELNEPV